MRRAVPQILFLLVVYAPSLPANEVAEIVRHTPITFKTDGLPGVSEQEPKETSLYDHKALSQARNKGPQDAGTQETNEHLTRTAHTRTFYRFDPEHDPLLTQSTHVSENAEEVIKDAYKAPEPIERSEIKTCTESKPEVLMTCTESFQEGVVSITPAQRYYKGGSFCRSGCCWNEDWGTIPESITLKDEKWVSTCENLEDQAKRGTCRLIKKTCPKGSETRSFQDGQSKSHPITKPCWHWVYEYACGSETPISNTECDALRASGCEQIDSVCTQEKNGICVAFKQTLRCPKNSKISSHPTSSEKKTTQKIPDKTLVEQKQLSETPPSEDMLSALSTLMILQEAQKERKGSDPRALPRVFKGNMGQCTIAFAGFKNCCTEKGKGWGVDMGLAGCDGEDKDLAQKRAQDLCIEVGTYCAEKTPVIGCIRKKKRFCCFPNKLSRLVQEQGRSQLGTGFGEAEHPNCEGFTVEELSRLDFDRLDLSPVYADTLKKIKPIGTDRIQQRLKHRMQDMTQNVSGQTQRQQEAL